MTADPPGVNTGPRPGSDPYNSAMEIAVLRAEVRALERRTEDRDTYHRREHTMIQTAVDKAEQTVNLRLEGMNELRQQITDERGQYLERPVYDAAHDELRRQVTTNTEGGIKLTTELAALREDLGALKSGQEWLVRLVAGAVITGVAGAIFALLRS